MRSLFPHLLFPHFSLGYIFCFHTNLTSFSTSIISNTSTFVCQPRRTQHTSQQSRQHLYYRSHNLTVLFHQHAKPADLWRYHLCAHAYACNRGSRTLDAFIQDLVNQCAGSTPVWDCAGWVWTPIPATGCRDSSIGPLVPGLR